MDYSILNHNILYMTYVHLLPYPSASTEGTNAIFKNINNEDAFYNIMADSLQKIGVKLL